MAVGFYVYHVDTVTMSMCHAEAEEQSVDTTPDGGQGIHM